MIRKVLIAFALALVVFGSVVILQAPNYHVERTVVIAAPRSAVFALVNDFHRWPAWSPWAQIDPAMKVTLSGPESGVGSTYSWSGNNEAGAGAMTIRESDPDTHVGIDLTFSRPYASAGKITFVLLPSGQGTKITWSMDGENSLALKALSVFSSMDRIIGPDFETGLRRLKVLAEGGGS